MKNVVTVSVLILSASLVPAVWAQDLPAGEGRDTLKKVCTQCHDIDSIPRLRYSRSDWANLVFSMKDMGADATSAELDQIIDYLTKNFGKGDEVKRTNVNSASAKEIEAALGFTTKESEAIVLYRMKNGNYKDIDTVKKVEGVDAAKVQSVKDKIEF